MPYTWLATGSYGRREPFPSSDVDSRARVGGRGRRSRASRAALPRSPGGSWRGSTAAGLHSDPQGAVAGKPLFTRSIEDWEQAIAAWSRDPDRGARADDHVRGDRERRGLGLDRRWPKRISDALGARARAASSCSAGCAPRRSPRGRRPASCATSCSTRPASAGACSTSSGEACCRSSRSRAGAGSRRGWARPRRASACVRREAAGTLERGRRRRPARCARADVRAAHGASGRAAA